MTSAEESRGQMAMSYIGKRLASDGEDCKRAAFRAKGWVLVAARLSDNWAVHAGAASWRIRAKVAKAIAQRHVERIRTIVD
jgi:hypothetical protein